MLTSATATEDNTKWKKKVQKGFFLLSKNAMEETTERLSYKRHGKEDRAEREKANDGAGIMRKRLRKTHGFLA